MKMTKQIAKLAVLALLVAAGSGCVAFNVGDPEVYTTRRGDLGRVKVTRQKRMSFGLLPALAENYSRPPESIKPLVGWQHSGGGQYFRSNSEPAFRFMFCGLLMTPWALLVTPWYGDYPCDTHHWTGNNVELIRKLPAEEQEKLHVKTWKDDSGRSWGLNGSTFSHSALLGFHRYETVVVEEQDADEKD